MPVYHLHPQDLLFFRDARPMSSGEGTGGHGARWPEPSLIFDVLHAALHRALPDKFGWHPHRTARNGKAFARQRDQHFGSLQTAGLFPVVPGAKGATRWLFPCPADVIRARHGSSAECLIPLESASGMSSDLPTPLTHALASRVEPDKTSPPPWWSLAAWQSYLGSEVIPSCPSDASLLQLSLFGNDDLFAAEWTTGIGMDPDSQSQDGQRIYSAEYLRLRDEVAMGFVAATSEKKHSDRNQRHERLDELFPETDESCIVVGGQQRVCSVEHVKIRSLTELLPVSAEISGHRVKWVLLSPAVFPHIASKSAENGRNEVPEHPGGWLPTWIDPRTGAVKLVIRSAHAPRRWNEQRQRTMRDDSADRPIHARLIAARIPKSLPITGWSERLHLADTELSRPAGPRPLHLAVPAGAVYYFEAEGDSDAEKQINARHLANALSWHGDPNAVGYGERIVHRRSSLLGEKGFGLGVCGNWNYD